MVHRRKPFPQHEGMTQHRKSGWLPYELQPQIPQTSLLTDTVPVHSAQAQGTMDSRWSQIPQIGGSLDLKQAQHRTLSFQLFQKKPVSVAGDRTHTASLRSRALLFLYQVEGRPAVGRGYSQWGGLPGDGGESEGSRGVPITTSGSSEKTRMETELSSTCGPGMNQRERANPSQVSEW